MKIIKVDWCPLEEENERRCPHYRGFEYEKTDACVYEDRPLAIFCEDERKVLIEEESDD